MPLDADYAERLRSATEQYLRRPEPIGEGDPDALTEVFQDGGRLHLRLRAGGRVLEVGVDDDCYHLTPDGTDPAEHANWLAQEFNEDAQADEG